MTRRKILSLTLLLIFLLTFPPISLAWSGKAVGIADGDTLTVLRDKEQVRIGLYGIATLERGQAFSKKAKQFASEMLFGEAVEVVPITVDHDGRTVGLVYVDRACLNGELIRLAPAWFYHVYCNLPICAQWKQFESEAKKGKGVLWSDPGAIPPWEYRKRKRREY